MYKIHCATNKKPLKNAGLLLLAFIDFFFYRPMCFLLFEHLMLFHPIFKILKGEVCSFLNSYYHGKSDKK